MKKKKKKKKNKKLILNLFNFNFQQPIYPLNSLHVSIKMSFIILFAEYCNEKLVT